MNDTKYLLIESAIRLFKQNGYKNVTIDDIANDCGLSKGAFYHYFKSKAEILGSYNTYTMEKNDVFTEILISNTSAYEKLWNLVLLIYGNSTDNLGPDLIKELIIYDIKNAKSDPITISEHNKQNGRYGKLYEVIIKLIEQGQKEGTIKGGFSPFDLTNSYIGSVLSSATNWYSKEGKYNRKDELKTFFEIIFKP